MKRPLSFEERLAALEQAVDGLRKRTIFSVFAILAAMAVMHVWPEERPPPDESPRKESRR